MNLIMIRKPVQRRKRRVSPPSYVGEWLRAVGIKPAQVARETGVNEGYLSQIISGARKNPSPAILVEIAKAMPQPFDYTLFYRPPPNDEAVAATQGLPPALLNQLRRH